MTPLAQADMAGLALCAVSVATMLPVSFEDKPRARHASQAVSPSGSSVL
jgi:hypothetical protein